MRMRSEVGSGLLFIVLALAIWVIWGMVVGI